MTRGARSALEILLCEDPVVVSPRHLDLQCLSCGAEDGAQCEDCSCLVCDQCQEIHTEECHLLARANHLGLILSPEIVIMVRLATVRSQGGDLWDHIGNTQQLCTLSTFSP